MTPPKNYFPLIAAAVLGLGGLVPVSFGDEKEPAPQNLVAVTAAKLDPVEAHLTETIVNPLNLQANFRSKFSRRMPTQSMSYHLVENSEKTIEGERHFMVVQKATPFMKGSEAKSTDFLKVRFVEKTHETLVDLKGTWVKPGEHPILKLLPKPEPREKITP